jgi:nucleotide-binding universal stress UspA family protein
MDNILVPYDFSKQSEFALQQAVNLARRISSRIVLLYVNETPGIISALFGTKLSDEMIEKINDHLDSVAARISLRESVYVEASLQNGRIYTTIVKTADEMNSKFIVMGTRSSDGIDPERKRMMGANTSRVIRSANCPVITISGSSHYNGCRSILLPMDLTKETKQKVQRAIEFAKLYDAQIRAVSAVRESDKEAIERLNEQMNLVKNIITAENVKCEAEIIKTVDGEKAIVPAILNYAREKNDVDLIMIMTQQEHPVLDFFVGSHAQEFIRSSEIPVISIIPQE